MKTKRNRKQRLKGVVAIEFAIGAAAFFMMIFYWIEVSYMGFVSATVDMSVAEAGRAARTGNSKDYEKLFKDALKRSDSFWVGFIDTSLLEVDVNYFGSISALQGCGKNANELSCQGSVKKDQDGNPIKNEDGSYNKIWNDHPLAIYRVEYPYQPLIAQAFFPALKALTISREVIAVQEYQRSMF